MHTTIATADSSMRLSTPAIDTISGTENAPAMRAITSPVPISPNSRLAWRTS